MLLEQAPKAPASWQLEALKIGKRRKMTARRDRRLNGAEDRSLQRLVKDAKRQTTDHGIEGLKPALICVAVQLRGVTVDQVQVRIALAKQPDPVLILLDA